MTFTRTALGPVVRGRSLLAAVALAGLLLGGCAREHPAPAPAPAPPPAASSAGTDTSTEGAGSDTSTEGSGDVADLLNEVDRQLSADDQPAEDQD
jgi:hypothetical protein